MQSLFLLFQSFQSGAILNIAGYKTPKQQITKKIYTHQKMNICI